MKPLLLFIHGFNSSPLSHKAQVMSNYLNQVRPDIELLLPQISSLPAKAWTQLNLLLKNQDSSRPLGIVGSSLGGFFAAELAKKYDCPAVLINPAVKPYELLADYLGPGQNNHSGERYTLGQQHITELKALESDTIAPENLWVLLQTGDEVLDFRQALERYQQAKLTLEPGGDHSFVNFERYPQQIIDFLKL